MAEYLLVDGYNIIHGWQSLRSLADDSLDSARVKLLDVLSNHQGFTKEEIIVVFDAHKVQGAGSVERWGNIKVVYTKEAETADNYIERVTATLAKGCKVRVATSDYLEQIIIMGRGAYRVSARELQYEVESMRKRRMEPYINERPIKKNMLLDNLDQATAEILESMRRQKG